MICSWLLVVGYMYGSYDYSGHWVLVVLVVMVVGVMVVVVMVVLRVMVL